MAKRQIPEWFKDYYANSAGGSVLEAYRTGRVNVIHADNKPKPKPDSKALYEAEAELKAATDEVNRQYWLFTRTAKGSPPTAEACRRRSIARQRVMDLKSGRSPN